MQEHASRRIFNAATELHDIGMRARSDSGSVTGHRSIPGRNAERMEAARAYRRLHTGMAQAVADSLTLAHRCAHRYLVKGASQWESKDRMQRRTPTRRTSGPGRGGWRWGRLSLSKPCSTKTT